jgi:hypothetical protein
MEPFYPADPIADTNTLAVRLSVAGVRFLNQLLDGVPPEKHKQVPQQLLDVMAQLRRHVADRDAGEHCFVSMGDPFKESTANGCLVARDPLKAAGLEHVSGGIEERGTLVAAILRRRDGDWSKPGDPGERFWYVFPLHSVPVEPEPEPDSVAGGGRRTMAKSDVYGVFGGRPPVAKPPEPQYVLRPMKTPYGCVQDLKNGTCEAWQVRNHQQPFVYRASMESAVLTCYLRGKRAADKRAAQKAAQKGGK